MGRWGLRAKAVAEKKRIALYIQSTTPTMSKIMGIQRSTAGVQQGPTLRVTNEQALQMLRTKMAQRLSSQASGGELRRSFELLDRDKSGNVELKELEEVICSRVHCTSQCTDCCALHHRCSRGSTSICPKTSCEAS
jgi:hypothetical protein